MLQKIILLTVSYFCVGTELRFLNNSSEEKAKGNKSLDRERKLKKEQSEMWHAQALEASARFLPSECPLVAHVITNYQKHHSPALTTIPEDEPLEDDLKVIRPLNEVKNDNINYYQIIRNHLKPEPRAPIQSRVEPRQKKSEALPKALQKPDLQQNFDQIIAEQEEEPIKFSPQPQKIEKFTNEIETKSINLLGSNQKK